MSTADRSVRLAWAEDVPAIMSVQKQAWVNTFGELGETLTPDSDWAQQTWRTAITRPATARQRVLVALERATVCGFVLTAPASDPDLDPSAVGELLELMVLPGAAADGHDARLSQAAIDTLRADGFTRVVTWLLSADDTARAQLLESGWAPDGAFRELDVDGTGIRTIKQVRLHTDIS
jgi:ribosomal protein S18 acetylase RimI-like enzyme